MNQPLYIIERWTHGILICSSEGSKGVPMSALSEVASLGNSDSVIDPGIAHHYKYRRAVFAITDPEESNQWKSEITRSLQGFEQYTRWWRGIDVGTSSAAMFAALVPKEHQYQRDAEEMGRSNIPLDASDFGRCSRLLLACPSMRGELHKVAEAYPKTKWPQIIARWDEIEKASPELQSQILRTI